jgi:hypothetical protein
MPIGNALSIVRNYRQFIPYITSVDNISAELNKSGFSYQITADNDPISFKASPIPSGLVLNTTTGLLSGTPTSISVGGTYVTLSATNSSGTGTKKLLIKVIPPPPVIVNSLTAYPIVNTTFNFSILATNMLTNYGAIYGATNLPTGFSINTGTGIIQGKLDNINIYESTITASNNGGSDIKKLVFDVLPRQPVVSLQSNDIRDTFIPNNHIRITFSASNSATSYDLSELPLFLSYTDPVNHVIEGNAPIEEFSKTYFISISARNRSGIGIGTIAIKIVQPPVITNLPTTIFYKVGNPVTIYQITAKNEVSNWRQFTVSGPAGAVQHPDVANQSYWDGQTVNANNVAGAYAVYAVKGMEGTYVTNIQVLNQYGGTDTKQITVVIS